ncbi:hypothetical protein TrVE_jg259 [Triparma verrucosa]|uniref:Uncharacterized protein n=1 Tax=Triparma verrucosa TaxID=1606542 RepID=A0A9W7FNK8_9STRA|nr:hypothetical protein TrVE_jg259 [Triparma verrucosa]
MLFSANTQLTLRAKKRKIQTWVTSLLSPSLNSSYSVMCMEVTCNKPMCAPLETVILFVPMKKEEKKVTVKILMPMAEVEETDIKSSLPSSLGGEFDPLKRISELNNVVEDCIEDMVDVSDKLKSIDYVIEKLRGFRDEIVQANAVQDNVEPMKVEPQKAVDTSLPPPPTSGNFVINRKNNTVSTLPSPSPPSSSPSPSPSSPALIFSSNTSREKSKMSIIPTSTVRGAAALNEEREHAPGVRKRGCPCCDPDDPRNVMDSMMML